MCAWKPRMGYSQHPHAQANSRPGHEGPGGTHGRFASSDPVSASMQTLQWSQWNGASGKQQRQVANSRMLQKHLARRPLGSKEIQRKRRRTTRKSATKECAKALREVRRSHLENPEIQIGTPRSPLPLAQCSPKSASLRPPRSRRSTTTLSPTPIPREGRNRRRRQKLV